MSSWKHISVRIVTAIVMVFTFKVTIVEGDADAVQSKAFEKLGIGILEEIFQKLERMSGAAGRETVKIAYFIEEEIRLFLTDGVSKGLTNLVFTARVAW